MFENCVRVEGIEPGKFDPAAFMKAINRNSVKGNEMTKILVSISGNKALMVDFDSVMVNQLMRSKVVTVDTDWEGNIKNIEEIKSIVNVRLITADLVSPCKPSREEEIKELKMYREKMLAEIAELDKQIDQ